jgi:hypothetical protein
MSCLVAVLNGRFCDGHRSPCGRIGSRADLPSSKPGGLGCIDTTLLTPQRRHSVQQGWQVQISTLRPIQRRFHDIRSKQSEPQDPTHEPSLDLLGSRHLADGRVLSVVQHTLPPERPCQRLDERRVGPDPSRRESLAIWRHDRLAPGTPTDGERHADGDGRAHAACGMSAGRRSRTRLVSPWTRSRRPLMMVKQAYKRTFACAPPSAGNDPRWASNAWAPRAESGRPVIQSREVLRTKNFPPTRKNAWPRRARSTICNELCFGADGLLFGFQY